jgi:hypothetical protein
MTNGTERDIEGRLKSLTLKPAPPGLREKILGSDRVRESASAGMSPLLWKCVAACAAALAVAFIAGGAFSRAEQNRLLALLDGRNHAIEKDKGNEEPLLTDILKDARLEAETQKRLRLADQPHVRIVHHRELLTEFLKEDFDDREITKNLD